MYTQIWIKYLPIIKILLKKAKVNDQTLNLNVTDFERAGAARKAGYKFNIEFSKGRVSNIISSSQLAKDLAYVLLEDATVKELFNTYDYTIGMNSKFNLSIKCVSKPEVTEPEADTVEVKESVSDNV